MDDPAQAARFRDWARRWGEDEEDACVLHDSMWGNIQRHVMGIIVAQCVWDPEDSSEDPETANREGGVESAPGRA